VVGSLAERHGISFKRARRFIRAEVAEAHLAGGKVVLAMPHTFMNESGQAVAPLARYYGVDPARLLVVHDDIDLDLGILRVQLGRGPGGHNGVESIIRSLGTRDFWRLRCGVGRPPSLIDPADFVLRPFSAAEREVADAMVAQAADLVETFVEGGGEAARQRAGERNTPQ